MNEERRGYAATKAIEDTFGHVVDELFANFNEELCVAQDIDMFHLGPEDWDRDHVAVFSVAYAAFLYRHIFAGAAAPEELERTISTEAERAATKLLRTRNQKTNGGPSVDARVEQLSKEWLAMGETARALTPFSRTPEAILFVCRHLLKPESQTKAENLALMPFLQIYIPERFSEIQRLARGSVPTGWHTSPTGSETRA
jgi:hypothetical protein